MVKKRVNNMKVVMVDVISANGKLTRGWDPNIYKWTSREDQEFFFDQIAQNNLIVMGSGTYRAIRPKLKVQSKKLRIILTSSPEKYEKEQVKGALEFSSETPGELAQRLEKKYKQMLLVGGGKINSAFLKANLVDEIYLTIEPMIFGQGKNLVAEGELDSKLKLKSLKKLNKRGTIHAVYSVEKS